MIARPREERVPSYLMRAEDVAAEEGCSVKEARRRLREGLSGPAFRRGKRLVVLRRDWEKALARAARVDAIGGVE